MPNDALRAALTGAKMTERDLAAAVGVDEKTVSRWVANVGRIPHPRHRWDAAAALEVDESVIWPDAMRATVKTGHDREIVTVYPYRSACPKALWRDLTTKAERMLTFAGYTNYFLWLEMSNLRNALRRKAERGCAVRFVIGDPNSEVTRTRELIERVPLTVSTRIRVTLDELQKLHVEAPTVEARFHDGHISLSVFQFDDDMIVNLHLADLLGHDSPTLHIRRRGPDGMFDRFAQHVDYLWRSGRDVWEPPAE